MFNEIFTTMMVFLDSANREIVKSALGFIKLAVNTYPTDVIREHLRPILRSLLGWSHGNKNHFKLPVRHICERLMRRVGYGDLVACVEDSEDGKKILVNIKKRKEHAKKKKAKAAEQQDQVCAGIHSVYLRPPHDRLKGTWLETRCWINFRGSALW
jgi:ribosomal RNA-processing protein 12